MGFCLVNNVAVAAASLLAARERVLIVDWDVHHGNGTQELFWDEDAVLYVSTHQWPLYPGTGKPTEVGGAGAIGTTLNIPVPPGATGDVLRRAFDDVVAPAAGRVVLFLEGGYDLRAVRRSTAATIGALLGEPVGPEEETFGGPGAEAVRAAAAVHRRAVSAALGA